jgi:hypothetical protein
LSSNTSLPLIFSQILPLFALFYVPVIERVMYEGLRISSTPLLPGASNERSVALCFDFLLILGIK